MSINLAPVLDSVGIKVVINSLDISPYVSDVTFNGEYKLNDTTTFGYGVGTTIPYGGSRYSPSIDISTFELIVFYNQVATTGIQTVFLSVGGSNAPTGVFNNRGGTSTPNAPVAFVIGPAGNTSASGNYTINGNCYAHKMTILGKVGNAVTARIEFKVDGGCYVIAV
mgnify:CR=1 FL=1